MNLSQFQKDGKYLMLALDHRGSFKKLMNPQDEDSVSKEEVVNLKKEIIDAVSTQMSGVLIDQDYGLPAYTNKTAPFLLPLEKTGYTDKGGERITEIEYTVSDLKADGASGAKLLIYFNPELPSSKTQLHTAKRIVEECQREDFPLFLEIVTYVTDGADIKNVRAQLVLDSVKMFISNGVIPSVWKLEYPGDLLTCQHITQLVKGVPWILLTRGDSFETFVDELKQAKSAGCSGFLAGRALWQEVCPLKVGDDKDRFLKETYPNRFKEICEIVLSEN